MKYLFIKDKKRRKLVKKLELKKVILKSIIYNIRLPYSIREYLFIDLCNLTKDSSKTRIRNRCLFTNRSRFVLTKYKLSRHYFKFLVSKKKIVGISRESW